MGVVKKKGKVPEDKLLEEKLDKAMTGLEDWATYPLPLGNIALAKVTNYVQQLSKIYGGKLFDKKTKKFSIKYCNKLLKKIYSQIYKARKASKDTSVLESTASSLESYLEKVVTKPKETPPIVPSFSVSVHDETVEFKFEYEDFEDEKCHTHTLEIPKETLDSWVESYANLLVKKDIIEWVGESPTFYEILDYFGVKREFQVSSNSVIKLTIISSKSKADEYYTTSREVLRKIRSYFKPEAKFQISLGPPNVSKSWKLQVAERVVTYIIAKAQRKAFEYKKAKEKKEKKKVMDYTTWRLKKEFPVPKEKK